ncbi:MAG: protein kinase [Proteobacteria bacterium]|nr:protein kinase [Pseudomonadota bacterium]
MEAATRYEILSKLAVGGMAEIFLARSANAMGVQRHVVLKRIHAEYADDLSFAQMFLDEARLASQLQHPNIAQVFDVGKLGDSMFFTMEYVHGETLRTILQHVYENKLELSLGFILTTAAGAAAGLQHAHERLGMDGRPLGIVHRDISPANVMTTYDGIVKIVDFGVAKASTARHQTVAGTVKGKISYMSPEQCRGNVVDRRSDLFSLGIVMWELLTRGRLYRRQSDFDSMGAIVNEVPIAPSAYRPAIPPEIDRLVLRLLAKDPDRRFASGDELIDELDLVASKLAIAMNPSAIKTTLRGFFGKKPEPWLAPEMTNLAPITLMSEPVHALLVEPLDESDDAPTVFSPHEVSAQAELPPPEPFRGTGTRPRVKRHTVSGKNPAEDLLGALKSPPLRQLPPERDFDASSTSLGLPPPRTVPDARQDFDDVLTILDDRSRPARAGQDREDPSLRATPPRATTRSPASRPSPAPASRPTPDRPRPSTSAPAPRPTPERLPASRPTPALSQSSPSSTTPSQPRPGSLPASVTPTPRMPTALPPAPSPLSSSSSRMRPVARQALIGVGLAVVVLLVVVLIIVVVARG